MSRRPLLFLKRTALIAGIPSAALSHPGHTHSTGPVDSSLFHHLASWETVVLALLIAASVLVIRRIWR